MLDRIITEDLDTIKAAVNVENFRGKNVLITGGAGFIGSWLSDVLVSSDARITVVDDFSNGRRANLQQLIGHRNFELIECDVCKFKSSKKFDVILHLAAHASPEEYLSKPIQTLQTSSFGTSNIAELARKNDASLLFSSTSEVYGDAEIVPTPESYRGNVNPVGPRSCYDEGKRFSEALLMAYCRQYGLDVRIPRIFNTYGPRLREDGLYGRALSRFIFQAVNNQPITVYGDGKQTRSFCYVADTVVALLLVVSEPKVKGEVVNIGNSQEMTIIELANRIKELTKSKSPIVFMPLPEDDPRRRKPKTDKIKQLTGWEAKFGFEEGVKRTIEWFFEKNKIS
jgi:UDP-glucuronate decarboxylase